MTPLAFSGRWVIVTGASAGLGAALSRALARRGAKLVLVARRRERLEHLAAELERTHGASSVTLSIDLSKADAAEQLFRAATAERSIYALISNAASYHFGELAELPEPEAEAMLQLNALTPIRLLRRFLPYFDARQAGGALVVTSTGALMPTPFQAAYGSSKAMLHAFVQSLQYERGAAQTAALCLCSPGGMPTDLLVSSRVRERLANHPLVQQMMLEPEVVAHEAMTGFAARRPLIVPGKLTQLMVLLSRMLPAHTVGEGARRVYVGR